MFIYREKELAEYADAFLQGIKKERFIMAELDNYVTSPNDRKVCCLYGLRRTGKAVMMMQEIRKLNQYGNSLFMRCEDGDTMFQVRKTLESNKDCKYVFIDEVTKTNNFIATASVLSDIYAGGGKKVVLAGTDSLGFMIARYDELYDRANFIHTTYIPFKEYHELLGRDIMDYIEYGGTLSPENTFYNKDDLNEYSNSAIVYNIIHTLENWNHGRNFGVLENIVDYGDLPSFINRVLERHNRTFLLSTITKDFKSHDLGSLVDLLNQSGNVDTNIIDTGEMQERIRVALRIKNNHMSIRGFSKKLEDTEILENAVEVIIKYLKRLDVLYEIPSDEKGTEKEYIFTQTGMRYSQASDFADILIKSDDIFGKYQKHEKREILNKLKSDICGGILEDIVFYQTARTFQNKSEYEITKYRDEVGREADVVVENYDKCSVVAIEVKLSDQYAEQQMKHLLNQEFCSEIESKTGLVIANKVVVYRGENDYISDKGVIYLNAEDYLSNTEEIIEMLTDEHIESREHLQSLLALKGITIQMKQGKNSIIR